MAMTKELSVSGIRQRFESMTRSTGSESDSSLKRRQPPKPKPKPKASTCGLSVTSSDDVSFESKQTSIDSAGNVNEQSIASGENKATFSSQGSKSSAGGGVGDEIENEVFEPASNAGAQSADTPSDKSADTPTNGSRHKFKLPPPPPVRPSKGKLSQLKRQDATMTSSCDHLPVTAGKEDHVTLRSSSEASYEDGDLDPKRRREPVALRVSKWSSTPSLPHNGHVTNDVTADDVMNRAKQKKTLSRISEVRPVSHILSSSCSVAAVDAERRRSQTDTPRDPDSGLVGSEPAVSHVTDVTDDVSQPGTTTTTTTTTPPAACPVPAPRKPQKKPRPTSIFPPDVPEHPTASTSSEAGPSASGQEPSAAEPSTSVDHGELHVTEYDAEIPPSGQPEPQNLTIPTSFQDDAICSENVCERSTSDERQTGDVAQLESVSQPEERDDGKKKKQAVDVETKVPEGEAATRAGPSVGTPTAVGVGTPTHGSKGLKFKLPPPPPARRAKTKLSESEGQQNVMTSREDAASDGAAVEYSTHRAGGDETPKLTNEVEAVECDSGATTNTAPAEQGLPEDISLPKTEESDRHSICLDKTDRQHIEKDPSENLNEEKLDTVVENRASICDADDRATGNEKENGAHPQPSSSQADIKTQSPNRKSLLVLAEFVGKNFTFLDEFDDESNDVFDDAHVLPVSDVIAGSANGSAPVPCPAEESGGNKATQQELVYDVDCTDELLRQKDKELKNCNETDDVSNNDDVDIDPNESRDSSGSLAIAVETAGSRGSCSYEREVISNAFTFLDSFDSV